MRSTLVPGLLAVVCDNRAKHDAALAVFEQGRVYLAGSSAEGIETPGVVTIGRRSRGARRQRFRGDRWRACERLQPLRSPLADE